MLKTKRRPLFMVSILSFLIFVSFSLLMLFMQDRYMHFHLQNIGDAYAKRLELFFNYSIGKMVLVADFIRSDPNNLKWLPKVAASLLDQEDLLSIELLWQNKLLASYPNEYATWALQNDFEKAKKIESLLATEVSPMFIPIDKLPDLSQGLSIMYPVYNYTEEHKFHYWGTCLLLMRIPGALKVVDLEQLESLGYLYRLSQKDATKQEPFILASSKETVKKHPVRSYINVGGEELVLELSLNREWIHPQTLIMAISSCFILSLLVAVLLRAYLILLQQREEVKKRAITDLLTSLYNKMHFHTVLEEKMKAPDKPFLLAVIDLNKFKMVNDKYGHDAGDQLIIAIAKRLLKAVKKEDLVFRVGGDEFVAVIGPEIMDSWINRLTKIKEAIEQPFEMPKHNLKLHISASIGTAIFPSDSTSSEEIFRLADERMLLDKEKSKKETQIT